MVVGGLEVSPTVHVPDDCHLFESVLHNRLWVMFGSLQLIGMTILQGTKRVNIRLILVTRLCI